MNAKKAKALRRAVREVAAHMPKVEYQPLKQTVVSRGPVPIPGKDYAIHLGHVQMIPRCVRAIYQGIKKGRIGFADVHQELRRAA